MEPRTSTADSAPPQAADPGTERTAVSGWVLRAVATAQLLAAFAQPVFAGVFMSGDFDGLAWHLLGADVVSSLGIAQIAAAIAVWIHSRRAWPFWASLALAAGETVQYFAGMDRELWLHFPLGVALVVGIAAVFAVLWLRPLPRRRKEARTDG